jgi:hypothetical protein
MRMAGLVPTAAGALALAAAPANAGDLNEALLDPEARWVVHINVEATRDSAVVRHLIGSLPRGHALAHSLDRFEAETGLDPLNDLSDVTICGSSFSGRDALLAFVTSRPAEADFQKFIERHGAVAVDEEQVDPRWTLHVIKADRGDRFVASRAIRANDDDLREAPRSDSRMQFLHSTSKDGVMAAIKRLSPAPDAEHAPANQTQTVPRRCHPGSPLLRDRAPGAILYAAGVNFDSADDPSIRSRLLRSVQAARFELRDDPSRGIRATAEVRATTPEQAAAIERLAHHWARRTTATIEEAAGENVVNLEQAWTIRRDDTVVCAGVDMPHATWLEAVSALMSRDNASQARRNVPE